MDASTPLFSPAKIEALNKAHRESQANWKSSDLTSYVRFRRAAAEVWPAELGRALTPPYDPEALDIVLRFLEEDPFFFQSGYVKTHVLRRLANWPLDEAARKRIASVVLHAVDGPPYREFRGYAKAARHGDRTILLPALLQRLDAGGTTAWQAFCAAQCLLGDGFPTWNQRHAVPGPQIEAMRRRIAALLENTGG